MAPTRAPFPSSCVSSAPRVRCLRSATSLGPFLFDHPMCGRPAPSGRCCELRVVRLAQALVDKRAPCCQMNSWNLFLLILPLRVSTHFPFTVVSVYSQPWGLSSALLLNSMNGVTLAPPHILRVASLSLLASCPPTNLRMASGLPPRPLALVDLRRSADCRITTLRILPYGGMKFVLGCSIGGVQTPTGLSTSWAFPACIRWNLRSPGVVICCQVLARPLRLLLCCVHSLQFGHAVCDC